MNRHKRTHGDTAAHGLQGPRALANGQDEVGNLTQATPQGLEMWNWQQESHLQTPDVPSGIESLPAPVNQRTMPFDYSDLSQAEPVSFDESEDILQYLFPSPVAWSMPETPGAGAQNNNLEAGILQGTARRETCSRLEEASPQPLLQLSNLIHETVSNDPYLSISTVL